MSTIYSQTLFEARNKIADMSVKKLCEWVIERIDENEYLKTEYFEIVDDETLHPVDSWDEPVNKVGCIAVHCDKIRLIDNIVFNQKNK